MDQHDEPHHSILSSLCLSPPFILQLCIFSCCPSLFCSLLMLFIVYILLNSFQPSLPLAWPFLWCFNGGSEYVWPCGHRDREHTHTHTLIQSLSMITPEETFVVSDKLIQIGLQKSILWFQSFRWKIFRRFIPAYINDKCVLLCVIVCFLLLLGHFSAWVFQYGRPSCSVCVCVCVLVFVCIIGVISLLH